MRSKRYFNWMYSLTIGKSRNFYRSLLLYLDSRTFTWSVRMDVNRAKDGCNLRKRFIEEEDGTFTKPEGTPCSVLEMMVALCVRCEEQIMSNPDLGNRVPVWFMAMLRSMEIDDMDEANFDETVVEVAVDRMLDRDYDRFGHGGLFACDSTRKDMRKMEIWYQAMEYFNEVLDGR